MCEYRGAHLAHGDCDGYGRMREPEPTEYTTTIPGTPLEVRISKVGGGTVGQYYKGDWEYKITGPGVWIEGADLRTGMPHSHDYVAALAPTFFYDELEAWEDQISLYLEEWEDEESPEDDGPYDTPWSATAGGYQPYDTAQSEAEYDLP
jgi:hypothetical protein